MLHLRRRHTGCACGNQERQHPQYLDAFTAAGGLTEADVTNDLRALAEATTGRSGRRVSLVGWSEGAGLAVIGAAGERGKTAFAGLITFG